MCYTWNGKKFNNQLDILVHIVTSSGGSRYGRIFSSCMGALRLTTSERVEYDYFDTITNSNGKVYYLVVLVRPNARRMYKGKLCSYYRELEG